jgi:hypothetical protein
MTDLGLIITYLLICAAIGACIASPIIHMKNDISKIKNMLMPIVGLVGIILLAIIISPNEVLPEYTNNQGELISSSTSKIIGGCLISFYILSLALIGSILYTEFLYKFFNNGKK